MRLGIVLIWENNGFQLNEKIPFNADDITEDRMLALRKRAEIDSKYFVTFSQNDENEMKQSLHRHALLIFVISALEKNKMKEMKEKHFH